MLTTCTVTQYILTNMSQEQLHVSIKTDVSLYRFTDLCNEDFVGKIKDLDA